MNNEIAAPAPGPVLPGTPHTLFRFADPEWLLRGDPREVQLEALRRSWFGYALHAYADDPNIIPHTLRGDAGPARGWGHFLQMRLGKTPIVLNEFLLYRRAFNFRWLIVLSPNAYKRDWPLEAEKFGVDIPTHAFDSAKRAEAERFVAKHRETGGMIVVHYEALKSEKTMALLHSITGPRTYIADDESILIKTHDSFMFTQALALAKECGARRPLTGKPITQGPHDMWAQLRVANALDGWRYQGFKSHFAKTGGFMGKQIIGVKEPEELRGLISESAFVARRSDWLKTPGVDYAIREVAMLPDQKAMYDRMEKDFLVELVDGTIVSADQIVTKLLKLQQIASGFIFDEERVARQIVPLHSNPAIKAIRDMLETGITGKTIIVAHHRPAVEMLTEALKDYKPAFIVGRQKDTVEQKARFNGDRTCRVLIGQEQALRFGHTLMGQPDDPCCTTIYFENNYSLNDRAQTEERNQGAGQPAPIAIWDLVVSKRHRDIVQALQRKEDVAAAILGYDRATGILPWD